MGRRRNYGPPPAHPTGPSAQYSPPPILEAYDERVVAGEPLAPVYDLDWKTGIMKLMDPQPPHPFPEAAAAWAAAHPAPPAAQG